MCKVPVVKEYPDVFPEELPGMPLDRDFEFIIDLLPGTGPIAKRPYKMDIEELNELKKQLKEQLVTRVNSTNVQYEGLRIGGIGRRMNSKVKSVKQGVYRK
jgi:hypothetical protein